MKIQSDIAAGAHCHHERYDGSGYTDGLAKDEIPKIVRIIAVADAFDNLRQQENLAKQA